MKAKEPKKESANAATESSLKSENHVYIAWGPKDFDSPCNEAFPALIVTSGHNHKAFGVSQLTNLIIDCGASSHFSPDRSKIVNFKTILPESVRAADGHSFSAIGTGDLVVTLPGNNGEEGPPIMLKRVYYAPKMAFTHVSVASLDKAGCSLIIEDGQCVIRSPRPYCTYLRCVPHINNLYRANSSTIHAPKATKLYANVASMPISLNELHRRMGHVNFQTLHEMVKSGTMVVSS